MKVRRISKTLLILIINIVVLVGTVAILGIVSINRSTSDMTTLIRQRVLDLANTAAASVDGDYLANLTAEDEGTSTNSRTQLITLFENINNTKERFDEIRVGVTEIQDACSTLNSSIQSLAAISEENATSIDVTASAFTDITDVIAQVSDRADLIKDQSNDLGNTVSKYNA